MVKGREANNPDIISDMRASNNPYGVRETLIKYLYNQTRGGLLGVLIVSTLSCVILWTVIPHWKLLLWFGILLLVSMIRVILTVLFRKKSPAGTALKRWADFHASFAILSAIIWAAAAWFLWPHNYPIHQLVWPICIVSVSTAAVLMYGSWKPSFFPFIFISVLSISIRLLTGGGFPYIILGILGLVFTALLTHAGLLMHNVTLKAVRASIHNESLNQVLSGEKDKIQKLNDQLQREILQHKLSQDELQVKNEKLENLNEQIRNTKKHLQETNDELVEALANVKQLSGMLPICASCKKIRNDQGYWKQLETYFSEHSELEFTHGLCPDCFKKLYPEYASDEDKDEEK